MKKISILIFTFISCILVYGQESNNELLKKLVEKNVLTQAEADQLKKVEQKSTIEKVRNAFNTPYMQFGGNGQLMYKYSDVGNIKHDFKPKNLFLSVSGKLNDSFRYGFLLEFVNPSVQEFWGEWTAAKEFNFKLGQFKVPVTLESQYVPATLETVAYSRTISNLFGYATEDDVLNKQNGKNNFGRDAGVQFSGELASMNDYSLVQYSLGMFQGMGVTTGEKNNTKDFAGTLLIQPVKGLRIGGGAYFGQATYAIGTNPADNHVRNRWIVSTDYKSERFNARAEWVKANDGGIEKEGLYGMALYYLLPKRLNALAKVDYYNRNKDVNSEVIDYTVGLNYYFYPQCRVQLNYVHSNYSKKWGDKDMNTIYAQLQIGF
ncbi:porin [Dysgonomonas sp.]